MLSMVRIEVGHQPTLLCTLSEVRRSEFARSETFMFLRTCHTQANITIELSFSKWPFFTALKVPKCTDNHARTRCSKMMSVFPTALLNEHLVAFFQYFNWPARLGIHAPKRHSLESARFLPLITWVLVLHPTISSFLSQHALFVFGPLSRISCSYATHLCHKHVRYSETAQWSAPKNAVKETQDVLGMHDLQV